MATNRKAKAATGRRVFSTGTGSRRKAAGKTPSAPNPGSAAGSGPPGSLRVRMFRVGFGDFFLISVPGPVGMKHILVDCGVHAGDAHSIQSAVAQLAKDTNSHLSLIVMTHRHADHISGFATCRDAFANFTVDRVWMSWFENPANARASAFQASLTAVAAQLQSQLALRMDAASLPYARMVGNALGAGVAAAGSSNQQALAVLHGGFKNKAPVDYYQSGDAATLPADLLQAGLTARILGPPINESLVSQMANVNQQYLAADVPRPGRGPKPFAPAFDANPSDYPRTAFRYYRRGQVEKLIAAVQPDVLAARAAQVDNTLNNQSLVILFTYKGKNLLFAGDAQWGNWENFLYGGAFGTPGHSTTTVNAGTILKSLDFYKVGHHGSANATPKDAVAAMRDGLVGMCSTQEGCYNGVPKGPLLDALKQKMRNQLARSDQVAAGDAKPATDAGSVPTAFSTPGTLFIDCLL
jgi:beta-lactamase superfamily II metal-dependent hydrolase